MVTPESPLASPLIQPLGDSALIVRFATVLSDAANRAAVAFARRVEGVRPEGVVEIVPNLVSVLLTYDAGRISYDRLAGEVRLLLGGPAAGLDAAATHRVPVTFDGPDIAEVAAATGLSADAFIAAHQTAPLRILATGFAPGFIYCGFHPEALAVPRRKQVRAMVPAGTVLFAARQTAITSTPIPTGWHVLGHTGFSNFDATANPPTRLRAGDTIVFEATS